MSKNTLSKRQVARIHKILASEKFILSDIAPLDLECVIPPEEARKMIAKEILKSMVIEKYRKEK